MSTFRTYMGIDGYDYYVRMKNPEFCCTTILEAFQLSLHSVFIP